MLAVIGICELSVLPSLLYRGLFRFNSPNSEASILRSESVEDVVYLSPADERANVVTHAVGILLSLLAMLYFWSHTAGLNVGLRLSCFAFTLCMLLVYVFSTLSHAVQQPAARHRMRAWDQGTIYLLIVGTYSPFIWQGTEGHLRTVMLLLVWGLAFYGFYSKVFASHRINAVATITYLALGWLPAIPLIGTTPWVCFLWMLLGGVSYSIGVLFLKKSAQVRYAHAAWHLMVMLGSACHCIAIRQLLLFAE